MYYTSVKELRSGGEDEEEKEEKKGRKKSSDLFKILQIIIYNNQNLNPEQIDSKICGVSTTLSCILVTK